jgi:hypothetical protein
MARFSDEAWEMIEENRDRAITARSAHSKRGHCGKRGGVKMPSDSLTAKQKKALNGECKTYRMNDPMSWETFESMPADLQKEYIKKLRERFGITDDCVAEMMDCGIGDLHKVFESIGLGKCTDDTCDITLVCKFRKWWIPAA